MLDAIEGQAGERPTDCVDAFEGLHSNPATAEQVDAIGSTTEIEPGPPVSRRTRTTTGRDQRRSKTSRPHASRLVRSGRAAR